MRVRIYDYEKYPFFDCLNFEDWKADESSWFIEGEDSEEEALERFNEWNVQEIPDEMYERITNHFNDLNAVQSWLQGFQKGTETIDSFPLK